MHISSKKTIASRSAIVLTSEYRSQTFDTSSIVYDLDNLDISWCNVTILIMGFYRVQKGNL